MNLPRLTNRNVSGKMPRVLVSSGTISKYHLHEEIYTCLGFLFVSLSQGKEEGEGAGGLVAEAGRAGAEARNSEQRRHHPHLNVDVAPSLRQGSATGTPHLHAPCAAYFTVRSCIC